MREQIRRFVLEAWQEDLGRGDLFELMGIEKVVKAEVIAKSEGVFSGRAYVQELCHLQGIEPLFSLQDGERFEEGKRLLELRGDYTTILKLERTILNLLQHSSGIATQTRRYVDLIPQGSKLKILDTRKTRPLLRMFEKYSVRNGGGINHRLGLDDCLMLKDTHLRHIGDLHAFIKEARKKIPWTSRIEVEVESVQAMIIAAEAGADIVMCDNMSLHDLEECAKYRARHAPRLMLEASGNLTEDSVALYAKLGFDAISSGSLIHQARWLDMSLKMR